MNFTDNILNYTTFNQTLNCTQPQYFDRSDQFFECYHEFLGLDVGTFIAHWLLIIGTVSLNILLVIMSTTPRKNCVFNDILVGHALVDGLTGLVDIPLYHIYDRFGYWPLGATLAKLWLAYDGNINITTTMHMLYATYARLRSIMNPQGYKYEILLKKPYLVMGCFWTFGLSIWIPIVFGYGIVDYTNSVNIQPAYVGSIVNLITWFTPLVAIFLLSLVVYIKLIIVINRTKSFLPKTISNWKKYRLAAQFRFFIIIMPFFVQWFFPSMITVVVSVWPQLNQTFNSNIYW